MYGRVSAPLALLALALLVPGGLPCPRICKCLSNEVHCTFRSMLTIPPGLPTHTQRINLGFNFISSLDDGSLAGLKRAELLMLHSNNLRHLPDGAFKDMRSLQILKLSFNKLSEISSSLTFSGLTSLLRLYLDHNLLQHIHPRAFLQLPSLRLLRLQGNRLHQLHPHSLCTLSLLNTYYFSTLRHIDVSNNSLTTLPREMLDTAPMLETLMLKANPWSCDCRMNWFVSWSLAHPGLMKCPGDPQCPTCATPKSLQERGLFDQTDLPCASPVIPFPGRNRPLETELTETQSRESFREPLGGASVTLSDQQGNSVDLSCNVTHSPDSQDIYPLPDLTLSSSSPIPLSLSLSLECPVDRESYEQLWRVLAYYSETAVRLEREIMLSKAPALAYRYRQTAETDGYYHTGVKASVKVQPQWLLQPTISIQLNRAQSNAHKVHLIYSTRVSTHPDPTSYASTSAPAAHPWVLISKNHSSTTTATTAVSGSKVILSCPLLNSGSPQVKWITPDGSTVNSPTGSLDSRLQASASGLLLEKVQLSDAGLYYCVAQAGMDVDVHLVRLAVEESSVPPTGEQVSPPVTREVGKPVSLSCNVSGSPTPYLSWMLPDGNIIHSGLAVSGGLILQPNGSLLLPKPSLRDAGYYRCIAVNNYGSDSLSMLLELKPQQPPLLRTSFRPGPQSAAGRSTRIQAPLLHQMEEGSGDEEEEDESTLTDNRKRLTPRRPLPNRRFPFGNPKRRGPIREGPPRRGGGAVSSTDQRRNRFDSRHRVTTNRQRIDPKKWADLLAKIRQKTTNVIDSQTVTAEPTAEPVEKGKDQDIAIGEGNDTERSRAEGDEEEAETEGSSVDDTVLQEEGLQPIHPVPTERQPHTEPPVDTEINREQDSTTETPTDTKTQNPGLHTETVTKPEAEKEAVPSKLTPGSNEIIPATADGDDRGANPNPARTRPRQRPLPNLVPNSRPWNSRRRLGQQRRIMNRPRVQPLTPPRPLPDLTHQSSQTATPDTSTDQRHPLRMASTTTSPSSLLTRNDHNKATPNGVAFNPLSPPVSHTLGISSSDYASRSLTSSAAPLTSLYPSHTQPHIDTVSHSVAIPDTAESTLFFTVSPARTHSDVVISQTHVPDIHAGTLTHGVQTHTKTHIAQDKHVDSPSGKHSEEQERNFLVVPSVTHSTTVSSTVSSTVSRTASATTEKSMTRPTTSMSEDRLSTTSHPLTTSHPITAISTTVTIPTSTSTRRTTTTTPTFTSTTPTTTSASTTHSSTSTATTPASTTTLFKGFPITPTTTITTTSTTMSTTTSPTTTRAATTTSTTASPTTTRAPTTTSTTTTSTSTRASFRERPSVGRDDTNERPVSGASNQGRPSPDWKNPGANSIPDSHGSRPHWSPSLPAVPGAPVVRTRPRIADPHIRTVSVPAESTARLACEAQGEPKPSITWTKVATGAVMSIHSKAQRFEVLPNGTLVIQNVQLQDRGTYICSAHSFLGRDRLLTTLEVWTRPPRMQLASYREATIHQGGDVLLECRADGVPTPLLSWVLPDRSVLTPASPSASRLFIDTNGTLHIPATLPGNRGVYRCVASNSAGAASSTVRVHVSSLPPVIQQPREEHLLFSPGRHVYAHCSARGAPLPTMRWRIPDGTLVRPSQFLHGNLFVLPNGTLHIRSVGPKDSGIYECTASNAVGADKRTVTVRIEGGEAAQAFPIAKPPPSLNKDTHIFTPGNPTNTLNSPKLPPPLHTDRSRTLAITPSVSRSSLYLHRPRSTLTPPKINKTFTTSQTHSSNISKTKLSSVSQPSSTPTHNSKVLPGVVNHARVSSSSHSNNIKAPAIVHSLPVSPFSNARIVSTSPSISAVHYGEDLQLHCSVTGNPPPTIIWRTPNRKLVDMNFSYDHRLKVHPNGTLTAQAVTEKDAGDYLCIARNKVADDYRLLRVSVATKPAKIEPKHPLNQLVSLGKPLKVDCQASGLPDPAVHWSLPDGTMVNSVLQGENRGGRARRLTVFDNGTLLVPAVGIGEEGEYTCYAQNQGGQDMMKVKVKVMSSSAPSFTEEKIYYAVKVNLGTTATIRCQAIGDPAPMVTWYSPGGGVIPRSLGTGYYSERVVVVSDGTLEVRHAQKIDSGNYTCKASNSAGERSMTVGLEVEPYNHPMIGQVGGGSISSYPSGRRPGVNIDSTGLIQFGFNHGASSRMSNNDDKKLDKSNAEPNTGSNPAPRSDSQNGFNRPVSGITTLGGNTYSVGMSGARNLGITRNGPSTVSGNNNSVGNSHGTVPEERAGKTFGRNYNEVFARRVNSDDNSNRDNGKISSASRNLGIGSGVTTSETRTTPGRNWFSRIGHSDVTHNSRNTGDVTASNTGIKDSTDTVVGVVKTVRQRAMKGQTVLLPCPSQGSPPPRLTWLLPGNGVLPAPYYGSRLTVYRNGSLELRGVRTTDEGTLVCVVRGERGETRVQVELEVSEPQEEARGAAVERPLQRPAGSFEAPQPRAPLVSSQSISSVLPEKLHPRPPVTQRPPQRGSSLPGPPRPFGSPPRSGGPASEPAVNTRTASLVSIINGETLHLPCPQTPGSTRGSLSWTMPSGKVLSQGESGDSGRYLVQEDGTLRVQQATVFDRGSYTCRSTSHDSSSVSLIMVPVIVIAYPPRITAGPAPVTYTRPGVAVELPCLSIATPRATLTWETPDLTQLRVMAQARIYGNRYLSPQGSLVIQNPTSRDTGFYRCTAKNVIGVDTKTTYLHVM